MRFTRLKFFEILYFSSLMSLTDNEDSRITSTLLVIAIHEYRWMVQDGPGRETGTCLTATEARIPRNTVPGFARFRFRFRRSLRQFSILIAGLRDAAPGSPSLTVSSRRSKRPEHVHTRGRKNSKCTRGRQAATGRVSDRLPAWPTDQQTADSQRSSTTAGRPHTRILRCCVNEWLRGYMRVNIRFYGRASDSYTKYLA